MATGKQLKEDDFLAKSSKTPYLNKRDKNFFVFFWFLVDFLEEWSSTITLLHFPPIIGTKDNLIKIIRPCNEKFTSIDHHFELPKTERIDFYSTIQQSNPNKTEVLRTDTVIEKKININSKVTMFYLRNDALLLTGIITIFEDDCETF